uniref:Uncharacterized protein n=1 Tax=Aegilops tauschii TaxID=37682 RepID=M8CKR9_AEGTA
MAARNVQIHRRAFAMAFPPEAATFTTPSVCNAGDYGGASDIQSLQLPQMIHIARQMVDLTPSSQ